MQNAVALHGQLSRLQKTLGIIDPKIDAAEFRRVSQQFSTLQIDDNLGVDTMMADPVKLVCNPGRVPHVGLFVAFLRLYRADEKFEATGNQFATWLTKARTRIGHYFDQAIATTEVPYMIANDNIYTIRQGRPR